MHSDLVGIAKAFMNAISILAEYDPINRVLPTGPKGSPSTTSKGATLRYYRYPGEHGWPVMLGDQQQGYLSWINSSPRRQLNVAK